MRAFRPVLTLSILAFLTSLPTLARADEETVRGDGFELSVTGGGATAGRPTTIVVAVTPRDGFKVNEEYPIALEVSAPEDVAVPRTKLGRAQAKVTTKRAELAVAMTPRASGKRPVTLALRFAVCTDRTCEPRRETVVFQLNVR